MTRRWSGGSALLLAALLPAACMKSVEFDHPAVGGGGGGMGGSSAASGGSGGSGTADGGGSSDAGNRLHCTTGTQQQQLTAQQNVPSIMFALDRSPSMTKNGLGLGSRFSVAGKAITDSVSAYSQLAQFGYVEFPDVDSSGSCPQNGCCAGGVVLLGFNSSANPIQNQLMMCQPTPNNNSGNCAETDATPTGQALKKIANNLTGRWLYAVVLTDGPPTCFIDSSSPDPACEQTQQQISRMASFSPSTTAISTLIVAIGSDSPDDAGNPGAGNSCLTKLSAAGGYPTATPPFYVTATTESQVHSVVDNLVTSMICRIDITEANYDPTRLEVDFGSAVVAPDPTRNNGWDLDRNTGRITIYGPACSSVIAGMKTSSHRISVKGCVDTSHPSPFP